jgi:ApaG protein
MTESPYSFKIQIETDYLSTRSDIETSQFAFSYTISIINTGALSAQLISRHWFITNGNGEVREVQGLGVVGEQPLIAPGQCYRYTSGAMLATPLGTMHGTYQMLAEDGRLFDVIIPVFRLAVPELVN